ncbi:MAG: terminase family protein, partial [Clostridia bacterium]
ELYELRKLELDENDISKKIIETQNTKDLEVLTDTGYSKVTEIHKTQPYRVYELELETGKKLECADNHIVFLEHLKEVFVKDLKLGDKIITIDGIDTVKNIYKRPYKLCMYDISLDDINHRYYSNGILSHNTTTTVAFLAWYLCFHVDRNCAVMANKQDTAIEIMNKLTDVFRGLPFFLKPGITTFGKKGMKLDNGCMIMSSATTKTASIGFTIHVLYLDEAAHVNPTIMGDLWRSVYPTLSSSKISQCIISSTPNGTDNKFYEIWDQAINAKPEDKDSFYPIRVDWWEVPGHDEEWAKSMRKKFGDAEFEQEFALSFSVSSRTLLGGNIMKFFNRINKNYNYTLLKCFDIEEDFYRNNLIWHPKFDVKNIKKNDSSRRFVISVDTGEGKSEDDEKEPDYNVANIFEIKLKSIAQMRKLLPSERKIENMFRIEQVGIYRDNIADEEVCAKITNQLVFNLLGEEVTKINVEMNFNGKNFINIFKNHENYYEEICVKTHHSKPIPGQKAVKKIGYKTNSNKDFYCKEGKRHLESTKTIVISESQTIKEINSYGKDAKGKYKGLGVKDDTSITVLMLSRWIEQEEYKIWLQDLYDNLPQTTNKNYADMLLNAYVDPEDNSLIDIDMYIQNENEHMIN